MKRSTETRLFGTDGIRERVGNFPLDKNSLLRLGQTLGEIFKNSRILIGRDTRQSGEEIENIIVSGISNSAEIFSCGIIPTPGLSYITDHSDFDLGIMITASHNPYQDNGIKIFKHNGEKITEKLEQNIEEAFFSSKKMHATDQGNKIAKPEIKEVYSSFLQDHAKELKGRKLKMIVDCANGATYEIAPEILRKTDINVSFINSNPNGKNINLNSGSTHPQSLKKKVIANNADIGIAFDGDGDRVIFTDNCGNILDGDHALFVISKYLLPDCDKKNNNVIVGTTMSNLGLEKKFEESGIRFLRADVGDKHVYTEMKRHNSILGGEQAGHIILRNLQKTGDGILTAIFFLKSLLSLNIRPSEIFNQLKLYPQINRNIYIKKRKKLEDWSELNEMIDEFNSKHGKNSRIVIRYSGTEPKIRIMIESERISIVKENILRLEKLIKSNLGE